MQRIGTRLRALFAHSLTRWVCLPVAAAAAISTALSQGATTPPSMPAVSLANEPLYARGVRAKPTLTLALSVEFPTVGQAYPSTDAYATTKEYIGYFDPAGCYTYIDANKRFERTSTATNHTCGGTLGFSGNFMNWASTSAIDILRYGLTGGDRITDTASETVLQRAVIPTNFYNSNNFTSRSVDRTLAAGAIPAAVLNGHTGNVYVANCLNRVFFGTAQAGNCDAPGNNGNLGTPAAAPTSNAGFILCALEGDRCDLPNSSTKQVIYGANSSYVVRTVTDRIRCENDKFGGDPIPNVAKACYYRDVPTAVPVNNTSDPYYTVRVSVCNSSSGSLTDPRPDLCVRYPNGNFKPVGNLQKYSDRVRVAAFGYLRDDDINRYGGVLRAPMKYVGPKAYDANFTLLSGANAAREWDELTGVFMENPNPTYETTGTSTGFPVSGVTNYLNRFGRTGSTPGVYKTHDPVGELYYEALRYLQGLPPTAAAVSGLTAADTKKDGFPVYESWVDPHPAVSGLGTTGDYSCVKNNLLTIGDVNTHADKTIPGNTRTGNGDSARSASIASNEPDFKAWTRIVGAFEANRATETYSFKPTSGPAVTVAVDNPNTTLNSDRWGIEQSVYPPCCNGNSYYMAGMAYWANTHDIRGTDWTDTTKRRPGMRVKTFFVDVNEHGQQTNDSTRRDNQFYLASKYGGFRDESEKGNPFYKADGTADNGIWQQSNGDAKTYFLAGDPLALLASLDTIFQQIASEASSIAGGAITTQTLTSAGGNIYQATFDPSDWSGDVISYTLGLNADGSVALGTSQTAAWRAGAVLDARTTARNIVVGKDVPTAAGAAVNFEWNSLSTAQQIALQKPSAAASAPDSAASGAQRLDYIRGDRSLEIPAGPYRKRASRLGDIVNSGVVFKGAPTLGINDSGYAAFHAANKNRTHALYVGANDGMLHAFDATSGSELFAYIPNFLMSHLSLLASDTYSHQRNYVDATPVVGEADLGTPGSPSWKTVLVSGVGGGGQGVFALDVTNPSGFTAASVLWEFTDANDPALGNVVGRPQILKIRTSAHTATTATYKWFAVFASGVNNYVADGQFSATGDPALFFLDLSKPAGTSWAEGSNYFKITFPQASTTLATGMVGFSATGGHAGEVGQIYAGDLQGNLWKLDFMPNPAANATAVNVSARLAGAAAALSASNPLFVAKTTSTALQPISMEPSLLVGPNRSTIVAFGTGKFLETSDTNGSYATQSVYAILDNNAVAIPGRGRLNVVTQNTTTGALSANSFAWGVPSSDTDTSVRAGWYLDFANSATTGERQISGMGLFGSRLIFGSVIPAQGGCDEGGGNLYIVTQTGGIGSSTTSTVGILGAPFVLQTGSAHVTGSDSTGLRKRTTTGQVILQGSSGLTTFSDPSSGGVMSHTDSVGRLSWRLINNFQEIKAAP